MYPDAGEPVRHDVVPGNVFFLLRGLVAGTIIFSVLIFFIPLDTYRFYGNFLEVGIALFCMCCCLYAYRTWSARILLLLAAFAFLGYALSNTFWYLYAAALGRQNVFFSVSELGFLGFMFFFIVAFRIEFVKLPGLRSSRIALVGLLVFIALLLVASLGITPVSALLLFRILIVALFLNSALEHAVYRYSLLWAGICLWSFASIVYGFRDTFVITHAGGAAVTLFSGNPLTVYDFLSIIGPFIFLSFLLIQLGLFTYLNSPGD